MHNEQLRIDKSNRELIERLKGSLRAAEEATQARVNAAVGEQNATLQSRDITVTNMAEQIKKLQEKNCRLSDEWSHMKNEMNKVQALSFNYQSQHSVVVNRHNASIRQLSAENSQLRALVHRPDRRDACVQVKLSSPHEKSRTSSSQADKENNHYYERINLSDIISTVQCSLDDIHATVSLMTK